MGLFFERNVTGEGRLAVWKMEEPVEELCKLMGLEKNTLPHKSESRQREWLAIRFLLMQMTGADAVPAIEYDAFGKPFLLNSGYSVSISHTKNFACILLSSKESCGIDLETIHPRIKKIAPRFLSASEDLRFSGELPLEYLYIVWGAKEVMYKLYGKGSILFKEHLAVMPFDLRSEGTVRSAITTPGFSKEYQVHYQRIDDLMLTWCEDDRAGNL